jgi:hypothetical protein
MYDDGYRYYKSDDGKDFAKEDSSLMGTVYHTLFQTDVVIQGKIKPDGGVNFPGKSCKDLQLCHPEIESGPFYIDPNMGGNSDKFIADCDFKQKKVETCIRPKQDMFVSKMDGVDVWKYLINDLAINEEIAYNADQVALRYMRLNSMSVRQTFTYHCRNQHASTDASGNKGSYVMVKGANGAEIDSTSGMAVINDECNKLDGKWHSASFELKTSNLDALPISDIKIRHIFKAEEFKIEVGPICFS